MILKLIDQPEVHVSLGEIGLHGQDAEVFTFRRGVVADFLSLLSSRKVSFYLGRLATVTGARLFRD